MNKINLYSRIKDFEAEVSYLMNSLYTLRNTDITKQSDIFQSLSTNIALRSERVTCQLRHLVLVPATISKAEYMMKIREKHDTHISYENDILELRLPGLLPRRPRHSSTAFLNDPLHYALQAYLQHSPLPIFDDCVIFFAQVYDQNLNTDRVRDYDNLEFKQILDTIGTFVLKDDGGIHCDTYHTTQSGAQDCTAIHIMEELR